RTPLGGPTRGVTKGARSVRRRRDGPHRPRRRRHSGFSPSLPCSQDAASDYGSMADGSHAPAPPDGRNVLIVVAPPSTDTTSPVMYAASSLRRNATNAATSSGVPARRSGVVRARATMSLPPPAAAPAPAKSAVGTMPGATALTRTPSGPP